MIIKLNYDLLSYKKKSKIDIDKIPYKEKQYFLRRLKDSTIDNCVEIEKEKKQMKLEKKVIDNLSKKVIDDLETK